MEPLAPDLPAWKASLIPLLFPTRILPGNDLPRLALVGLGAEDHGDEAAGLAVARVLRKWEYAADVGRVCVLEASRAPANLSQELRSFRPQVVILVEALDTGQRVGEIGWFSWETRSGSSAAFDNLPLRMLARYLWLEFGCTVHLLAIQPAQTESGSPLSSAVSAAVAEIAQTFCRMLFCH